jgi:hypothetical protein
MNTTTKEPNMSRDLNPASIAAKQLRAELKAAFPGVKFTVRSSTYSMGDSIRVGWTDGPTPEAVEAISGRYQEGSFDGMIDLYTYSKAIAGVGAKHVFCNREISDAKHAATVEAIRAAYAPGSHEDFETLAYRALRASDLTGGAVVAVVDTDEFPYWAVVVEGASSSIVRATVEPAPAAVAVEAEAVALAAELDTIPVSAREAAPEIVDAEIVEAVLAAGSVPVAIADEVTAELVIDASTADAVARVSAWWDSVRSAPAGSSTGEAVAA